MSGVKRIDWYTDGIIQRAKEMCRAGARKGKKKSEEIGKMIIYVKEYKNALTVAMIKVWIKQEIQVVAYCGESTLDDDYVVVSKYDKEMRLYGTARVIEYEDLFDHITQCMLCELKYNYDYYYLRNALTEAKKDHIDTIISGSSYGVHGIDRKQLVSAVNLSLISQDLYYSIKGIEAVCNDNEHIKNIVICCSYYYFYSDISMSETELPRVSNVYYPLFGDLHNALCLPLKNDFSVRSKIIDVERVTQIYSIYEYNKYYYNEERPETEFAVKKWCDKNKTWQQLSEEERVKAGKERAQDHNKAIKYEKTYKENLMLLKKLSQYCEEKQINLIFVVAPASKYYREALVKKYKEDFYNALNNIGGG